LIHGAELDKCIVPLHIDTNQFAVGREQHLEIFALSGFLVKVDHKECFGRRDFLATFIFFALDASISTGKFSTKGLGNHVDVPVCFEIELEGEREGLGVERSVMDGERRSLEGE
jgi:hypothetical protein